MYFKLSMPVSHCGLAEQLVVWCSFVEETCTDMLSVCCEVCTMLADVNDRGIKELNKI